MSGPLVALRDELTAFKQKLVDEVYPEEQRTFVMPREKKKKKKAEVDALATDDKSPYYKHPTEPRRGNRRQQGRADLEISATVGSKRRATAPPEPVSAWVVEFLCPLLNLLPISCRLPTLKAQVMTAVPLDPVSAKT